MGKPQNGRCPLGCLAKPLKKGTRQYGQKFSLWTAAAYKAELPCQTANDLFVRVQFQLGFKWKPCH